MKPCRDQPCTLARWKLPSGGWSPYCYWHRLARTSPHGQEIEAQRRRDGQAGIASAQPGMEREAEPGSWRLCQDCASWIPKWYAVGSRCKACNRLARRLKRLPVGFTPELVRSLLSLQDGRCAICRNRQVSKALAGDHDHKTGQPRGLLCDQCNHLVLGGAHDSLRILRNAVYYLETPPTSGRWERPESR